MSDCKITLENALFHRAGTPGQPWEPSLLAFCPAAPVPLPCPAATWHIALWAACDGVISPLSMNPTGSGSPWLFPVFPRLPALRYHSADKGSLGLPPALSFVPPGSQPCVRSPLPSVLSPLGTSLPCALLLLVQLRGRMAGLC